MKPPEPDRSIEMEPTPQPPLLTVDQRKTFFVQHITAYREYSSILTGPGVFYGLVEEEKLFAFYRFI